MRLTLPILFVLSLAQAAPQLRFTPQTSGVTARFRGISAVNDRVAWASGSNGTILRTADGGASWQMLTIAGTEKLDFRDIDAVNERTAYVLSIGNGEQSRIYKTTDAGANWREQFVSHDPKAFFDAMAFWDEGHGIAFSDSADNLFNILATSDAGATWTRIRPESLPAALPNEGAFAASGTNVYTGAEGHVWIGTGAAAEARVLRSSDGGKTWAIAPTPVAAGPSSGIFSIAFRDETHGIVVGGDYRKEGEAVDNAAITSDGGATWRAVKGLSGFRSVVAYVPGRERTLIAVGPSGADYSTDDGEHWTPIEGPGYHTFSFARSGRFGWGAGEKGTIGRLDGRAF